METSRDYSRTSVCFHARRCECVGHAGGFRVPINCDYHQSNAPDDDVSIPALYYVQVQSGCAQQFDAVK